MQAQVVSGKLMDALSIEVAGSPWAAFLGKLIGAREAVAFFHRRFSWHEIYVPVLAVLACRAALTADEPLQVLWSPDWPIAWQDAAEAAFSEHQVKFARWPAWYARLVGSWLTTIWAARSVVALALALLRGEGDDASPPPERVPLMLEFVDEGRMSGTSSDTNYWEDGEGLCREDVIYFLAAEQRRQLRRSGQDPHAVLDRLRQKGFRVTDTKNLRYKRASTRDFLAFAWALIAEWRALYRGASCLAYTFWRGVAAYLEFKLLFDRFAPANVLHTQSPNGNAGGRYDSAVLTGLCRRAGSRCVGYQNRIIYGPVYEDSYDCYDAYLTWGRGWPRVLGNGTRFVDQIVEVGDWNNDGLAHGPRRKNAAVPRASPVVTIFTMELWALYGQPDLTIRFLSACARLALQHVECHFQVKTKDPGMVSDLLKNDAFRALAERAQANFSFLDRARHDCAAVIDDSDIVIATGFTTPGADALVLGRRVVFYSELEGGGEAFLGLPNLVATSPAELASLFEIALNDYGSYSTLHADKLRELDPHRDGQARGRVLAFLAAR
jgi:hypothetical protein